MLCGCAPSSTALKTQLFALTAPVPVVEPWYLSFYLKPSVFKFLDFVRRHWPSKELKSWSDCPFLGTWLLPGHEFCPQTITLCCPEHSPGKGVLILRGTDEVSGWGRKKGIFSLWTGVSHHFAHFMLRLTWFCPQALPCGSKLEKKYSIWSHRVN